MRRKLVSVAASVALLAGAMLASASVIAAQPCSKSTPQADISAMDDAERAAFDARPCNSQLVSYVKYYIPFDADGKPGKPVRLTQLESASTALAIPEAMSLGVSNTDDHGLYLSLWASRNLQTGYCSDWTFNGYFQWNNMPDGWFWGRGYDFWGITWSGNQANVPGPAAYSYDSAVPSTIYNHSLAQTFNNAGDVFRFYEWDEWGTKYERYGYIGASARQTTCNNQVQTVNLQYTHTTSGLSFSVSGGGSWGFSVTPGTDSWQFSVPTSFTS